MANRPRKPWRIILTGPTARVESEHASQKSAYAHLVSELDKVKVGERDHAEARVMQWSEGRWWHYETIKPEDAS